MAADRIGEWSTTQLTNFVTQLVRDDETINAVVKSLDEVTVNRLLTIIDEIKFSQAQSTVGAAGGASALPATPVGYFRVLDGAGVVRVIPYYNA